MAACRCRSRSHDEASGGDRVPDGTAVGTADRLRPQRMGREAVGRSAALGAARVRVCGRRLCAVVPPGGRRDRRSVHLHGDRAPDRHPRRRVRRSSDQARPRGRLLGRGALPSVPRALARLLPDPAALPHRRSTVASVADPGLAHRGCRRDHPLHLGARGNDRVQEELPDDRASARHPAREDHERARRRRGHGHVGALRGLRGGDRAALPAIDRRSASPDEVVRCGGGDRGRRLLPGVPRTTG